MNFANGINNLLSAIYRQTKKSLC